MRYFYGKLRNRAKERGHAFELTFDQYCQFACETGYDKLKGKTKHSLSIDRRDDTEGYSIGNIRAVTLSLNTRLKWANIPQWLKDEMVETERRGRGAIAA